MHIEIEHTQGGHLHKLNTVSSNEETLLTDFEDALRKDVTRTPLDTACKHVELLKALQKALNAGDGTA